jgi:hypothetical protein
VDSSKKYRKGHPEDVRLGELEAAAEAHVNMMDFRVGYETQSWFTQCFDLVQRFISEGGYRLYPDEIVLPREVRKAAKVTLAHCWQNKGWGYFPNNIPQWNHKYKVAFALLDSKDDSVRKVWVDHRSEPAEWLKGKPVSYQTKIAVDLPAGNYRWAVAIVDTTRDNLPAIKLAVEPTAENEVTNDGWIKLSDMQVK